MTQSDVFTHSTPALYDRCMGPLLFEPYATLVAERSAALQPGRILETAAGTGIVTRAVNEAVPQAQIVATDVNPAVEVRAGHLPGCRRAGSALRRRELRPRSLRVRRDVLP
jgi:predicted O-methyltransferase YrrM